MTAFDFDTNDDLQEQKAKHLLNEVIPGLFDNPVHVSRYWNGSASAEAQNAASYSAGGLSTVLGLIVEALTDSNPATLLRPISAWGRFLGRHVEREFRYHAAVNGVDSLLELADQRAAEVEQMLNDIAHHIRNLNAESDDLALHVTVAGHYLQTNPDAGTDPNDPLCDTRIRFEKRLANLRSLQHSHLLMISQLGVVRSQMIGLLDRYHEIATTLVPIWRQSAAFNGASGAIDLEQLQNAAAAHTQLSDQLAEAITGTEAK